MERNTSPRWTARLLPLLLLGVTAGLVSQDERFLTSRTGRPLTLPLDEPSFQFAVFADRTGGPADGVRILQQAVDETNLIGPDMVLTVGDLINGYNTTPEWMAQMTEYRGIMDQLDCPWFPVAGNHDVYWRGPGKPPEEHEDRYEEHFGPLWYAFEHKGSWFIILYTDEPDPDTGLRDYTKASSQRMSPVQFEWLRDTLGTTSEADHVFVFLHHPRWNRGNYGDDWDRVHELLAGAGNVRAVFAGHIHRMQYVGPRDGIEYFTLATTGANQGSVVPEAGYLHHYDLVTVREGGIDVVTFPVGSAQDPRAITREVSEQTAWLARNLKPMITSELSPDAWGSVRGAVDVTVRNPTNRPVDFTVTPISDDLFWSFSDHWHGVLGPGAEESFELRVSRPRAGLDAGFRLPELEVAADYLSDTARFSVPSRRFSVPLSAGTWEAPSAPDLEHVLALSGRAAAQIGSDEVQLPQGPFTLEAWVNGDAYGGRRGLINKTEQSEYGLFASDGVPSFLVYLGGAYRTASADEALLHPGKWHHVAGVYDGAEVRLYVDGVLSGRASAPAERKLNALPLTIGADVNNKGAAVDHHSGRMDEVRLSKVARYEGERFTPARRHSTDEDTLLLLHADAAMGPWLHGASPAGAHPLLLGGARVQAEL
ncbi:MAG: metallophosphoesterase [Planctomycetes bacterium]|nr:metallophosphoesterase [Planctomycetota bacterium]